MNMELTEEQLDDFKQQIIKQIESSFPEEKKESAIERINSMNREEFIEFLKKNKLLASEESDQEQYEESTETGQNETPFRMIIEGKIPSYKLDENKNSIAVLEIKPISKGHIIIIPKKAIFESGKVPQYIFSLAKRISKKIKAELKPKEVLISASPVLGEIIINVLPVYSNESLTSQRKQSSKEELEELKTILEKKQKTKTIKKPKIKKLEQSKMWLPRRIP